MIKVTKSALYVVIIIAITSFLAGCQGGESGQSNKDNSKGNDTLEFMTGAPGGTWATIGTGISDKVNDALDNTKVSSKPGAGSVGNPIAVSSGKGDIGMSYVPFLLRAEKGKDPYDKKITNLRAIASLTPTVVHFIQRADMGINTLEDFISKKPKMTLGIPPEGQGSNYIGNLIFSSLGIDNIEDSIKQWDGDIYYGGIANLKDAWRNRQINAMITTLNVPGSAVEESLAATEGKVMNIGDNLTDKLKDQGFVPYTIPKGTYSGQEKDVKTLGLSIIVYTRDDVPDDVVYELTKSIYENKDFLVNVHNSFKEFDPEKMSNNLGIKIHPGAKKFYEEKGLSK